MRPLSELIRWEISNKWVNVPWYHIPLPGQHGCPVSCTENLKWGHGRRVCPLWAVHCVVCPAKNDISAAPTGLSEVGCRNAESGLTTLLVLSCPEESWICSWEWMAEDGARTNNSSHGRELWDTNTGDILEPQQECWSKPSHPLRVSSRISICYWREEERRPLFHHMYCRRTHEKVCLVLHY